MSKHTVQSLDRLVENVRKTCHQRDDKDHASYKCVNCLNSEKSETGSVKNQRKNKNKEELATTRAVSGTTVTLILPKAQHLAPRRANDRGVSRC
jgi:hypothetical protein